MTHLRTKPTKKWIKEYKRLKPSITKKYSFDPHYKINKECPQKRIQNESDSNSTIPAFYGSEPESKPEPEKKPPLVKAQPLNQDFLDQLDKYHTDLKKPEEDEKGEKKDNQF